MGGPRHRECQTRSGRHLQVHTHAERGSAAVIAVVAAAAARALAAAARALAAAEPWIAAGRERATSRGYSCEFFFFCVACLACSCLLLPFSVFASFLLRTHQNHLPPCEVCFISVCPYFLFLPFSLLPSVCSLLFCLDSSKPTRLLFLFARSFCSVFPPFCFLRAVSSLRFGRFYSERRPPLSPYIGGRFPHISDSNSSFSCFSLSLHPTFFF